MRTFDLQHYQHYQHYQDYVLAQSVADVEATKRESKLAVVFDIEGGRAVEDHPACSKCSTVSGVRWMLIAYSKNKRFVKPCQHSGDRRLHAHCTFEGTTRACRC